VLAAEISDISRSGPSHHVINPIFILINNFLENKSINLSFLLFFVEKVEELPTIVCSFLCIDM